MKMRDIKLMTLLTIIIKVFHWCDTQYSFRYTFQNVTVNIKVSNGTNQWKKIFVRQARTANDFLENIDEKVKIISLKNQKIPALLTNSLKDITRLKRIRISSCGVEEVEPGCIKNVTKIFEFDLSHNSIRDIKYGVFNNIEICRLLLSNNKIHYVDREAFSNMTNLEMIVLSRNRLTLWDPSWFLKTPVRHVDFSSNMIEELPPNAFGYFKEFRKKFYGEFYYINFNNNALTKLKRKCLPEIPMLWFLFLEKNFIEEIEDRSFDGIKKVEALKLGENKLMNFGNEILGDVDVRYLKLNDNLLQYIDVNITEILNIEGNPLNTGCRKQWEERKKKDRDLFERYFYDS